MLIYDMGPKYTYDSFGKSKIGKQMHSIHKLINKYGDDGLYDVYPCSGKICDVSLHYLPDSCISYHRKIIAVELVTTAIKRSSHVNSLNKITMSYHKSYKNLILNSNEIYDILRYDVTLSKYLYIARLPVKLGAIRIDDFKKQWRRY